VREFFPVLFGAFNIHGFRAAMKVAEGHKGAWTLLLLRKFLAANLREREAKVRAALDAGESRLGDSKRK
jgi:hypothetical protein